MRTGGRICWEDTSEQELLGQNALPGTARVRDYGRHGWRHREWISVRVVGLGYDWIFVGLETDTSAPGDKTMGKLWHIPGFWTHHGASG